MAQAAAAATSTFQSMDNAKPSVTHWKIMSISGMAFFTDACDPFIIASSWPSSHLGECLVESTALLDSTIGALLFGRVADKLGPKRIYPVSARPGPEILPGARLDAAKKTSAASIRPITSWLPTD
jgi:hypothetical protein